MLISQDGATGLSAGLETRFNTITNELNSYIGTYSEEQNSIWRSVNATAFAGEINASITSINTALSSLCSNINSKMSTIVAIQNNQEGTELSWPTVDYTDVSKSVEVDPTFEGNAVGVVEGHNLSELKTPFQNIITQIEDNLTRMRESVNSNTMLSGDVKGAFDVYISNVESTLDTELEELNKSFENRITSEEYSRISSKVAAAMTASE